MGLELIERLEILLRILAVGLVHLNIEDIAQDLDPAVNGSSGR